MHIKVKNYAYKKEKGMHTKSNALPKKKEPIYQENNNEIKAGYSPNSAYVEGTRLVRNHKVKS